MRKGGRRSIRWRGFNYAAPRAYYVTVCVQGKRCLLGTVAGDRVQLNQAGEMVRAAWLEIPARFRHVELDAFVIMPNHIHGVLRLREPQDSNGLCRPSLADVVLWWKTKTTATYARRVRSAGWPRFDRRLWQRGYYERIIRDEDELGHARGYIYRNPIKWRDAHPWHPDET